MKPRLKTAAVLALWTVFTMLTVGFVLEAGTRMRFGRPLPDVLPDRETLFRYPPDGVAYYWFTTDAQGARRPMSFRTNALGLRDDPVPPEADGTFRILMLGDSFTAGMAIERLEDTIPRQLQDILRQRLGTDSIRVINGGLGNSAPYQQYALLRRVAGVIQPDLVILQLYLSNDLSDTLSGIDQHLRAYNAQNFIRRVSFARVAAGPGGETYMRLATQSAAWCRLANMLGRAVPEIYARCMSRIPGTWVKPMPSIQPTAHRFWAVEPNLITWYPQLELAYEMLAADVANIRKFCNERDIRLAGFAIPCVYSADPDRWQQDLPEDIRREREPGKDARMGDLLLDRCGVPRTSLYGAIVKTGKGADLYHYYDMHLNEAGARFTAEVLAGFLITEILRNARMVSGKTDSVGPHFFTEGADSHDGR